MVMKPITTSPNNKDRAILLRKQGMMYKEIAKTLNMPKSTVYTWLSDINLTLEEKEKIRVNLHKKRSEYSKHLNKAREQKGIELDLSIQINALKIIKSSSRDRNNDIITLSMLFWGEGEKNISSGVRFINSDPVMIKTFLVLFRRSFALDESKFRIMLHVHGYHNIENEIKFWSQITGIPKSQFHKPYIKQNTGKQKKNDYHGTISVRYADYKLGKLLKMVYTTFSQNIGE